MPKLEQKKSLLWLLLPALNLAYAVGLMLLCVPRWNANDDYYINAIAAGAVGAADAHVSFANIIMGELLKLLASVGPGINWFWIIQLCATIAAYIAIGYVLLRRLGLRWGLLFYLPFMLASSYNFYITWTFTRVASLVTAAGWLCWLWATEASRQRRGTLVGGGALILVGYLIRPESGTMITVLALAVAMGKGLAAVIRQRRTITRQSVATVAQTVLPVLALALCFVIDWAAYQTPGWKAYREYDACRTGVFDYNCSAYEENPEAFEALGISESDYLFATEWNYADPEKFSKEHLAAIMELPSERKGRISGWTLQNAAMLFVRNKMMLMGLLFAIVLLCLVVRFRWLPMLGLFGGTMVLLSALDYMARFPDRVLDSIGVAMTVLLLGIHEEADFPPAEKKRPAWFSVFAVAVAVPILLSGERWLSPETYRYENPTKAEREAALTEVNEKIDPAFLYLQDAGGQISFWNMYPLWEASHPGEEANLYALGGWHIGMPITDAVLQSYGVQNPMASFGENDHVLLIDSLYAGIQTKMNYVRRNYHPDITWSVYDSVLDRMIVAVCDHPTDIGPETSDVLLQVATGAEGDYFILSGTLQADSAILDAPESDTVRCLITQDETGVTKAFRFRLEQSEAGASFTVKIPLYELLGHTVTVSAAQRPAGTAAFTFHSTPQPLDVTLP